MNVDMTPIVRSSTLGIGLLALALLPEVAKTQVPMTLWSSPALINKMILDHSTNNFIQGIENRNAELRSGVGVSESKTDYARSTVVAGAGRTAVAAKLAAHYPPAQRPQVERSFAQVLDGYRQIESRFGIPRNDLAGAVAAFLAGSYMAYNDVDFPDEHFKPLVSQLRQVIMKNPEFQRASNAEKQEMYEQMAILGTSLALTRDALKQQPNAQIASNIRQAGKGYLEQFLKTDADRVQITSAGLVIR